MITDNQEREAYIRSLLDFIHRKQVSAVREEICSLGIDVTDDDAAELIRIAVSSATV